MRQPRGARPLREGPEVAANGMAILLRRAHRAHRAGSRWMRLRRKDLAWYAARRGFDERYASLQAAHRWVFIVGCNNSGTTLAHDVLAATGRFSFLPNEGQRYTEVLGRGDRKGHERVWSEYLDELRRTEESSPDGGRRLLFDWLEELGPQVKPRVLEKTTTNAIRMRWLQAVFPQAAFIGMVRDAYAVCEGIRRKAGKSVERSARHWARVNQVMLADAQQLERFHLLKYEQFVSSPQTVLPDLAQFLDLPTAELTRAFDAVGEVRNMNQDSLKRLTPEEIRTIGREAGDVLASLGYSRLS